MKLSGDILTKLNGRMPIRSRTTAYSVPGNVRPGALNLQDRKMTDREISGGGNCRTGK